MSDASPARSDLQRILESARRLRVEMDKAEARQRLGARAQIINPVDDFFHARLAAVPTISDCIAQPQAGS
jgi:hypothetical protein